jgi:catechol 2,3-dioxygenase-like lactoylglutathione lyase family enzyme
VEDDLSPLPSFPTLVVSDLAYSTDWYRDALGFELVVAMPDDFGRGLFTHLRWSPHADLLLVGDPPEAPLPGPRGLGVTLTFTLVDGRTIDEIAARANAHGAEILLAPVDRPWHAREVMVLDPDGYRLLFTQRIDPRREMSEMVAGVVLGSEMTITRRRRRRAKAAV